MWKLLRFLKNATEVLTTAGAVLAAAIVVVETYQTLRKKMDAAKGFLAATGDAGWPALPLAPARK